LPTDAVSQSNSDSALGRVLPDDVFVELHDNLPRSHVVKRGKKLLFFCGRGTVAPGREHYLFIGLAGHEMSNSFVCDVLVCDPSVRNPFDAGTWPGVLSRDL
jgi:hypothetical protein